MTTMVLRQIEYKAEREGVSVIYVPAKNTSKQCSACGRKTLESLGHMLNIHRIRRLREERNN